LLNQLFIVEWEFGNLSRKKRGDVNGGEMLFLFKVYIVVACKFKNREETYDPIRKGILIEEKRIERG
jgi:hypothetical protein